MGETQGAQEHSPCAPVKALEELWDTKRTTIDHYSPQARHRGLLELDGEGVERLSTKAIELLEGMSDGID